MVEIPNSNIFPLNEKETFKKTIQYSIQEVLYKYLHLIFEYIHFITENLNNKNKVYLKFIFLRGLDTITNVFNLVFFYTKNLDASFFHSQKAFYFYVEFIEQISNDKNSFLKLSSRDAIIYVYKKTIFLISLENKNHNHLLKENKENKDNNFFPLLNEYILINKLLLNKLLNEDIFLEIKEKKEILDKIYLISKKINSISLEKKKNLQSIEFFINNHFTMENNLTPFHDKLLLFLKKLSKD